MQQPQNPQKAQHLANLMRIYQAGNLNEEQKRAMWQRIIQQATNEGISITQEELQQLVSQHLQQQQTATYAAQQQQRLQQQLQQQQQQQINTSMVKQEPLASIPPPQMLHQQQPSQPGMMMQSPQMRPPYTNIMPPPPTHRPQPDVPPDPSQLVSKQKIQYLLSTIDPEMKIDDATCEMLIDVAQEFVQEITDLSSKLAHHRGSNTLMVKDAAKIAERFYDIRIPGFNDDPDVLTATPLTVFDMRGRVKGASAATVAGRGGTKKVAKARAADK